MPLHWTFLSVENKRYSFKHLRSVFHDITLQNMDMGGLVGGLIFSRFGDRLGNRTMPTRATELTPAQIKALKHPGGPLSVKVAVGGVSGLHVQIQPSGAKSWVLRTRYGDWTERRDSEGNVIERGRKKREIGLGAYPDILPGAARDKAREAKAKLEAGIDPIAEKRAAQAALLASGKRGLTFAVALDRYLNTLSRKHWPTTTPVRRRNT